MSTFEEHLRTILAPAYEIERELEGGGMSRVFVATDSVLGMKVVVKVLPPELTAGVNRERFRREIQVAAQLQHPHIVTLLSAGEDGDLLYYTMPFIEGESLAVALEKGPLAVKDVVRILHDVVDALAYAHARGVIHRDIKPGNILRLGSHALVTDFGVAKALNAAMPASGITTAGMAIGTPAYMAPEQLAGDPASDHRIDIYAVGLLAYELLTGESPFKGSSPQATMAAQLTRDPEPLYQVCADVPSPLSAIIMQCLAKEPSLRPPTAEVLMSALDSITTSSGDIKTQAIRTLPAVVKRRRRLTVGVAVATVALGSAAVLFASQRASTRSSFALPSREAVLAPMPVVPSLSAGSSMKPAPAPIALTRKDSLAIAEAVQKRLAQEESVRGRKELSLLADSITAHVRRAAIDSILRANLPRGTPVPAWRDVAPPPEWGGKRRVVVTEPRSGPNGDLNAFGKSLTDSIRRAFARQQGFTVVDADSVNATLATSRGPFEIERTLKPDLMIAPSFVGAGDTMTVLVTVRESRNGTTIGNRVASGKFSVDDPGASIPALVEGVFGQVESLTHMPPYFRVRINPSPTGARKK